MEYSKDILLGDDVIGTATVRREGLYYRICCKCILTGEVVFRIVAQWGKRTVSLGVCVPKDGAFGLEKRLPVKLFGEGQPVFLAVPNHPDVSGKFVPLRAEEPFAYIQKLQNSHIENRGGVLGVVLEGQ